MQYVVITQKLGGKIKKTNVAITKSNQNKTKQGKNLTAAK